MQAHKHTYTKDNFLKSLKGKVTGESRFRHFDLINKDLKQIWWEVWGWSSLA